MLHETFSTPTAPNITYCFAVVLVKDPIQLTDFRLKSASVRVDMFSPTKLYQKGRKLLKTDVFKICFKMETFSKLNRF